MKPIVSLTACIIAAGAILFATNIKAQVQDSFGDVPASSWAYKAITDFQSSSILIGYPDGFFSGKRVLTRYEFALATKRAIENVVPLHEQSAVSKPAISTLQLSSDQVQNFKRLIGEFSKDLTGLQVNVTQVKLRLDALASDYKTVKLRTDTPTKAGNGTYQWLQFDPTSAFTGYAGAPSNLFNFASRIGRVSISGEASRSFAQFEPGSDGQPGDDADSNAFRLNVRYDSGPVGILGGFQYIDPGYEAPDPWSRLGALSNLTNVQGPFLRVNYTLNPRTQFEVGSDLLTGARNRSYSNAGGLTTGFGTHDYISTLSAGFQYKLWNHTSLTADWEGVYWDLSSASSGLGVEAHPIESYINLGTGFNLRGNTMLKMGYQIGSFGNFSGFGGLGPSSSGQTYNAFTTQISVKF